MADTNNKVSLGCGTLILIALIVLIFGNANRNVDKELNKQFESLRSEIRSLKSDLGKQADTLAEIKGSFGETQKRTPRPRVVPPPARPKVSPAPPILEAPFPEEKSESPVPEN